jgi:hypothetical protein
LERVLSRGGVTEVHALQRDAEELRSGAHEFEEIRLVHLVRSGALVAKDTQLAELERLLGGVGHDGPSRLGLAPDASRDELRAEAVAALTRWQRLAEHPSTTLKLRVAARAASRSCEEILDTMGSRERPAARS